MHCEIMGGRYTTRDFDEIVRFGSYLSAALNLKAALSGARG